MAPPTDIRNTHCYKIISTKPIGLLYNFAKFLPRLKNIFRFGFCVFVFGKEVTGQCGNIVKTPPPTVNLSRREKREREGERDTKRTVNVILLTKLPDVQSRRHRSDQFKPCSIGSSLCLIVARHVFQCK